MLSDTTLTGTGTINLEGGTAVISDLQPGSYTVTISDVWGDTIIFANIIEPTQVALVVDNQTAVSCFGACDATLTATILGGTAPYTSNGLPFDPSVSLNNICGGLTDFADLNILDDAGCPLDVSIEIEEPDEIILTLVEDNPVSCFGGNDGTATVSSSGNPSSYLWDTGDVTATVSTLEVGLHNVTVTNTNGCENFGQIIIEGPLLPLESIVAIEEEVSCFDGNDGVISVTPVGGGSGFSYIWSNGQTSSTIENIASGAYAVTITDLAGCTSTAGINIDEPTPIEVGVTAMDITCINNNGGLILVDTVTGGVPGYLYSLDGDNFAVNPLFSQLDAGAYDVFIQDAAGCIEVAEANINDPFYVTVDLGADQTIKLGESIELQAITNSPDVVYTWTLADSLACLDCREAIANPIYSTQYTVSVLDTLTGCTDTDFITITVNNELDVFVPTAFSPNNDGQNDIFQLYNGVGVSEVKSFSVYNRWGAQMFQAVNFLPGQGDSSQGWDGYYKGKLMSQGVYIYFAEVLFKNGELVKLSGDFTLIR